MSGRDYKGLHQRILILYTRSQLVYSISAAVSTLVFCYFHCEDTLRVHAGINWTTYYSPIFFHLLDFEPEFGSNHLLDRWCCELR